MNDLVKHLMVLPVRWRRLFFVGLLAFTLFMALIPGSADPTTAFLGSTVKHCTAFFILAAVLDRFAFPTARFVLWKPVVLIFFGVMIEVLQYFTGYRTFSFLDMAVDAIGVSIYYFFSMMLPSNTRVRLADV